MTILQSLFASPIPTLIFLAGLAIGVTFHEFAHAWTADRLGDETPSLQGRTTLNPAAHLDPLGSLAFLIAGFGWGKPVEYNPMRLSRRIDELLIALAGPAMNLALAILCNLAIYLLYRFGHLPANPVLSTFALVNVYLASFNFMPFPPLDGSSIIAYFWPPYRSLVSGQIGLLILVLLIVPFGGGSVLGHIVSPLAAFFDSLTHLFGLLNVPAS